MIKPTHSVYVGIDIGSTAIKTALIDQDSNILATYTTATGSHFRLNARNAMAELLCRAGKTADQVAYTIATGYGRKLFKEADEAISEITANAIGAQYAAKPFGGANTVLNIGGQDSKAIHMDDDGHVVNFVMNDKCAAGTGRFLDVAARNLEVDLEDLGRLHFDTDSVPLDINSTCTVFAESEIISLLANGHSKPSIISGIHYSIARRTARMARRVGIGERVYFDGGPALNAGLVAALSDELQRDIIIPEHPQITTALGAALLAKDYHLSDDDDET